MKTVHDGVKQLAATALAGKTDGHVLVGPLVWKPSDDGGGKQWYFTLASGGSDGRKGSTFRLDAIHIGPSLDGDEVRAALLLEIAHNYRPIVIQDFGDGTVHGPHVRGALAGATGKATAQGRRGRHLPGLTANMPPMELSGHAHAHAHPLGKGMCCAECTLWRAQRAQHVQMMCCADVQTPLRIAVLKEQEHRGGRPF